MIFIVVGVLAGLLIGVSRGLEGSRGSGAFVGILVGGFVGMLVGVAAGGNEETSYALEEKVEPVAYPGAWCSQPGEYYLVEGTVDGEVKYRYFTEVLGDPFGQGRMFFNGGRVIKPQEEPKRVVEVEIHEEDRSDAVVEIWRQKKFEFTKTSLRGDHGTRYVVRVPKGGVLRGDPCLEFRSLS